LFKEYAMPLTITIVSEHRDLVGNDCVREYYEEGGTIGRSLENDWILPDPDRYISGRHATIDHKGGMYYLADTSSNGVYMNGVCAWATSNSRSASTKARAW
jgi:predicted component of type VI protein secretion system